MEHADKIRTLISGMSWRYYSNHINSTDSFRTRYYHYLRMVNTLQYFRYIFDNMKPNINNCLDIGCNWGYYSTIVGDLGIKVDALDINLDDSNILKHANVSYFKDDFLDFNNAKKYDLILAFEVYEHIPIQNRKAFVKKIMNQLEEGGILIFSAPNCISLYYGAGFFKGLLNKFLNKIEEIDWHYRIPFFFYNHMFLNYNIVSIKWNTNGIFPIYSNKFENLLNKHSIELLTYFDKYISRFVKGVGANYIIILKKGEDFDR